ncbi:MAG: PAS domain S-box protein [Pseudomonadota bacterium]
MTGLRIKTTLLFAYLLLSTLPLAGLAWLYLDASGRHLTQMVLQHLNVLADKKAEQIGQYLNERLADAHLMARASITQRALDQLPEQLRRDGVDSIAYRAATASLNHHFASLIEQGGYYDLLIIDRAGNVVYSILRESDYGSNLNTGPYQATGLADAHREALALLDTRIAPARPYAPSAGRPAIFVVTPVMAGSRPLGTLALQLDLDRLTEVTSDRTGLGETGETVLAQYEGASALYVGPLNHIEQAAFRYTVPFERVAKPMQSALIGGHGSGFTRDYVGIDIVAAWRHLPALSWGMVVKIDSAEAMAPLHRLRNYTWSAFVGLLLLASLVAILLGHHLATPIRQLMAATRRIAAGELDQRAPVSGSREVRQLALSFNTMTDHLVDAQNRLEARVLERTQALDASMRRYDDLVASLPVGVYTLRIHNDGTAAYEYVSPPFCRLLDLTPEAVLADAGHALRLTHPDDAAAFERLRAEAARTLTPFHWEGRVRLSGAVRWLRIQSNGRAEPGGTSVWNGVVTDITEAKLAELALHASEERFRAIFARANTGIAFADAQGTLIECNESLARMLGYSLDQLRGMNFAQFTHPDDIAQELALFAAVMAGQRTDYRLEKRYLSAAGETLWVDAAISPVRDADGHIVHFVGVVVDITARKQSELEYQAILATTQDGFWICDVQGRFLDVNEAYCAMIGYPRATLLEMCIRDIEAQEHPDETRAHIEKIQRDGRDRFETRHRHRAGHLIDVEVSVNLMPMLGGRLVVFLRDITARKRDEQALIEAKRVAEAASRAKSEFLANMSHEIRTPMNAVLGLTQLVLESDLKPKQRDYLAKALISGRTLMAILNDILDYSKIEAGRLDIEHIEFSVEQVLGDVANLFSARIEEKGLELFLDITRDVPDRLLGDPLRLTQVLNNLVGNAVKFTERGEITLRVELAGVSGEQLTLRFSVRDTGIGLARDKAEGLFQPFTQADGSITRRYGGTGLGLAICDKLVRLMGGDISVSSREGKGATFSFTIVVGRLPHRTGRDDGHALSGRRVLVVDDQDTARRILVDLLAAWGLHAEATGDGESALARVTAARLADQPYDILLLDWRMPGMTGLEVARRLQAECGPATPPLILMVTAHDLEDLRAEAGPLELAGFLSKPVVPSQLMDLLMSRPSLATAGLPAPTPLPRLPGARILLVEDNEYNQQVALALLERLGVQATLARDGAEALAETARTRFDAVLMDLHMPIMDGIEATRRLLSRDGDQAPPVIAMTAAVMADDRARCTEAGMVDFIAKPIELRPFAATLARWLPDHVRGHTPLGAAGQVPDLPGLDLPGALARLGDPGLLRRLLGQFVAQESAVVTEIDTLLAEGQTEAARERLLWGGSSFGTKQVIEERP